MNLYFELTYHCNAKCFFCDIRNMNKKDMSIRTFKKFLNEAKELKDKGLYKKLKITLSGGEPILHPQIEKFIEIGKKYGNVTLVTNGTLKNVILSLDNKPDAYEISFSMFEKDDQIYMIEGAYNKKLELVNTLIERGEKVLIKVTALRESIPKIKQLAEKYKNIPILVSPVKKVDYSFKPSIEQLRELNQYKNVFIESNCPAGRGFFVITPNSEVLSCFLTRKYLGKSLKEAIANSYRVRAFECETDQEYVKNLRCLR